MPIVPFVKRMWEGWVLDLDIHIGESVFWFLALTVLCNVILGMITGKPFISIDVRH